MRRFFAKRKNVFSHGSRIDPAILSGGKDGHFGLRGMRERAARIGARLTIMSAVGTGTDVTLVVPRSIASKNGLPLRRRLSKLPLKANDNPATLDS